MKYFKVKNSKFVKNLFQFNNKRFKFPQFKENLVYKENNMYKNIKYPTFNIPEIDNNLKNIYSEQEVIDEILKLNDKQRKCKQLFQELISLKEVQKEFENYKINLAIIITQINMFERFINSLAFNYNNNEENFKLADILTLKKEENLVSDNSNNNNYNNNEKLDEIFNTFIYFQSRLFKNKNISKTSVIITAKCVNLILDSFYKDMICLKENKDHKSIINFLTNVYIHIKFDIVLQI